MSRNRMLVGLLALLFGVVAQAQEAGIVDQSGESGEVPEAQETPLDVEAILTTPSETEYTESPRCLSTARIRRTEVLDERHIIFHMSRDQFLLVQFPRRCPMLDKNSALMYEVQGSRLCRLDRIRAVNGSGISRSVGPVCMIPGFEEVSVEQVALIRASLEELRRSRRAGPQSSPPPEEEAAEDTGVEAGESSEPS